MKSTKGISLIVLIITIIVMIILAGTIIISLNNAGILDNASDAVDKQNLANEKQRFELVRGEILAANSGKITVDEYIARLQELNLIQNDVVVNADKSKSVVTKTGYGVNISQDGDNILVTFEGKVRDLAIQIDTVSLTTRSGSIEVTVTLKQGTGAKYTYCYREQDSDQEYLVANENATTDMPYKITNLTQNTTYEIKVIATNSYGTSEGYATGRTGEVATAVGNISLKTIEWVNGKANITVEKGSTIASEQTIQYSLDDGKTYNDTTGNITGITNGTIVILRLTDGKNFGSTSTIEIIDETSPTVTLTLGEVSPEWISVTVNAIEEQSGVNEYRYYIKKNTESAYTLIETTKTGTYTFEGLEEKTEYDIKVEVEDNSNNIGEDEQTKIITARYTNSYLSKSDLSDIGYTGEEGEQLIIPSTFKRSDGLWCRVTRILDQAFFGCSNLTSITIPESVTSIGNTVFQNCSSLTSITIPNGVTSIGGTAFAGCSSLTSITIPASVTSIGSQAFSGCGSLTSIIIPEGVTSIGARTFGQCTSLTSVTIPEGVTSIGEQAFWDCSALTNITIPESVTSIEQRAFHSCSNLTSITIPNGVKSIGEYTFYSCTSLTDVTISEGVTSIASAAFHSCRSLTSITIPNSVTRIERNVFSGCNNLSQVKFQNTNGWWVSTSDEETSGTNVDVSDVSNAAKMLKNTYAGYYWNRSEATTE